MCKRDATVISCVGNKTIKSRLIKPEDLPKAPPSVYYRTKTQTHVWLPLETWHGVASCMVGEGERKREIKNFNMEHIRTKLWMQVFTTAVPAKKKKMVSHQLHIEILSEYYIVSTTLKNTLMQRYLLISSRCLIRLEDCPREYPGE